MHTALTTMFHTDDKLSGYIDMDVLGWNFFLNLICSSNGYSTQLNRVL